MKNESLQSVFELLRIAIEYYNKSTQTSNVTNYLDLTSSSTTELSIIENYTSKNELIHQNYNANNSNTINVTNHLNLTVYPTAEDILISENISKNEFINKKINLNDNIINYLASVQRKSDKKNLCIGSLITLNFILVTCSCVLYVETDITEYPYGYPGKYAAVAGYFQTLSSRNISKFIRDENCEFMKDIQLWLNNIGYVKLEEPFINYGLVPNLKLTQNYENLFYKMMNDVTYTSNGVNYCITFAWNPNGGLKEDIVMKTVQFATHEECASVFCNSSTCEEVLKRRSVFCAGEFISGVKTHLSNWDQGAPLICTDNLIGVLTLSPVRKIESNLNIFNKLNMKELIEQSNVHISRSRKIQNSVCLIILYVIHT